MNPNYFEGVEFPEPKKKIPWWKFWAKKPKKSSPFDDEFNEEINGPIPNARTYAPYGRGSKAIQDLVDINQHEKGKEHARDSRGYKPVKINGVKSIKLAFENAYNSQLSDIERRISGLVTDLEYYAEETDSAEKRELIKEAKHKKSRYESYRNEVKDALEKGPEDELVQKAVTDYEQGFDTEARNQRHVRDISNMNDEDLLEEDEIL